MMCKGVEEGDRVGVQAHHWCSPSKEKGKNVRVRVVVAIRVGGAGAIVARAIVVSLSLLPVYASLLQTVNSQFSYSIFRKLA